MKMVSIVILSIGLALSHAAFAADAVKPEDESIAQSKAEILKAVSTHIEALNKFKTCVSNAKVGPDIGACQQQKKKALKALRAKAKKARVKQGDNRKKEEAAPKKAE
ncbi:MAG: hypothetical protein OEM07_00685 [Gammaproteobacteria bacterium]|nr:hypothetical protein [Gammaproteobacteria bacterium]